MPPMDIAAMMAIIAAAAIISGKVYPLEARNLLNMDGIPVVRLCDDVLMSRCADCFVLLLCDGVLLQPCHAAA